MLEFLRPPCREPSAQQRVDFRRANMQQVGYRARIVAIPRQGRLEVIEPFSSHRVNQVRGHRSLVGTVRGFEHQREILLHLEWRRERICQAFHRCWGQNGLVARFHTGLQQPRKVLALLALNPVEGQDRGPRAHFFHGRMAQQIFQAGMARQHHGKSIPLLPDQFHQTLEFGERIAVEIVGFVN
jgi:hypothetical protein